MSNPCMRGGGFKVWLEITVAGKSGDRKYDLILLLPNLSSVSFILK